MLFLLHIAFGLEFCLTLSRASGLGFTPKSDDRPRVGQNSKPNTTYITHFKEKIRKREVEAGFKAEKGDQKNVQEEINAQKNGHDQKENQVDG